MKTYQAKTPHKKPCDLCGTTIIVGDRVTTWCWVNEDPPPMGGIVRVHATCNAIWRREGLDEATFNAESAFEEADDDRAPFPGEPEVPKLLDEALSAVARSRTQEAR